MTKLNKKKLNKSTIAIIFLALALVLAISFGATFALFTASSKNIGVTGIKSGAIKLSTSGEFKATATAVLPTQSLLDTAITVEPTVVGDTDAVADGEYVAMKVTMTGTNGSITAIPAANLKGSLALTLGSNWVLVAEVETGNQYEAVYVYSTNTGASGQATPMTSTATNASTNGTYSAISAITYDAQDNWTESATESATTHSDSDLMNSTFNVSVQIRGVQVTGNYTESDNVKTHKTNQQVANYLFLNTTGGTDDGPSWDNYVAPSQP